MPPPFPRMLLPQELTYEFLGTFARCEYALKGSGFAKGGASSVDANWDAFAVAIDWYFRRIGDQTFKQAVQFLLTEPPRKQVLRNGRVDWKTLRLIKTFRKLSRYFSWFGGSGTTCSTEQRCGHPSTSIASVTSIWLKQA